MEPGSLLASVLHTTIDSDDDMHLSQPVRLIRL